jgi:hypothetical protein
MITSGDSGPSGTFHIEVRGGVDDEARELLPGVPQQSVFSRERAMVKLVHAVGRLI